MKPHSNILLLQWALQPLWVLAYSTVVEYSQQEGFYRVPLPAASQTTNLEDQWLERSNSRHRETPASKTTQANPSSGRWNYGREIAENFAESGDHSNIILPFMPKYSKWTFSLRFPHQNTVRTSPLPHTCHMPLQSPYWFDYPKNI